MLQRLIVPRAAAQQPSLLLNPKSPPMNHLSNPLKSSQSIFSADSSSSPTTDSSLPTSPESTVPAVQPSPPYGLPNISNGKRTTYIGLLVTLHVPFPLSYLLVPLSFLQKLSRFGDF